MREIKFRVWDDVKGIMLPVVDINWIEEDLDFITVWDDDEEGGYTLDINEDNPDVIMQYTGLKDKNGKEIYEGDIIRITQPPREDNHIEYYEGEWMLIPHGLRLCDWYESSQVIGNIYENPELLEEKNES